VTSIYFVAADVAVAAAVVAATVSVTAGAVAAAAEHQHWRLLRHCADSGDY